MFHVEHFAVMFHVEHIVTIRWPVQHRHDM